MSIIARWVKPAPPPAGRTVSWPTHRRIAPGAPEWVRRQSIRVDILVTNVEGNVERITQTVELTDE